ncbi:hypothetical protein niasHT_021116 [Heterodera trifolii]|uniref:Uncharacterized protein n=1 Tax=Heterodera trifolii TaxID=157864 RepID=A0ABD2JF23_9BILA
MVEKKQQKHWTEPRKCQCHGMIEAMPKDTPTLAFAVHSLLFPLSLIALFPSYLLLLRPPLRLERTNHPQLPFDPTQILELRWEGGICEKGGMDMQVNREYGADNNDWSDRVNGLVAGRGGGGGREGGEREEGEEEEGRGRRGKRKREEEEEKEAGAKWRKEGEKRKKREREEEERKGRGNRKKRKEGEEGGKEEEEERGGRGKSGKRKEEKKMKRKEKRRRKRRERGGRGKRSKRKEGEEEGGKRKK